MFAADKTTLGSSAILGIRSAFPVCRCLHLDLNQAPEKRPILRQTSTSDLLLVLKSLMYPSLLQIQLVYRSPSSFATPHTDPRTQARYDILSELPRLRVPPEPRPAALPRGEMDEVFIYFCGMYPCETDRLLA